MEDKEFELEQNKFTFEKAKHIDDMRFQTFGTLYRQLFTFNIGILTLIFFVIYQSLEYDVSRWLHFFLMLAILLSTISIRLLVSVYVNSGKKDEQGNIKALRVDFGHGGKSAKKRGEKTMEIKRDNPERRKAFRARFNCDNPGPDTSARYWSCKNW